MAGRDRRLRSAAGGAAVAAVAALLLLLLRRPAPPPATPGPAEAAPLAAPAAPPAAAPPPRPTPPPARLADAPPRPILEGRVVSSETGAGVPGAELTFSRASTAAGARSGPDGAFRFEPPVEGRWRLAAVTAPGFLPFAPEWEHSPIAFEARAGQALRGVELRLAPALPLVGTVVDPRGAPVAGAEVRVLGAGREAALVSLEDRFTTDAAGQVRLSAPRGAVVEARKAGFGPGRAALDLVARAERRFTVRLEEGGAAPGEPLRIGGRVIARGGGPLPGALVVVERELASGVAGAAVAQGVTGADGAFRLGPFDPGRYRLTARAEGRARGVAREVTPGSEGVTLELAPGARLRGCVRDVASGAPVPAFTVLVSERRAPLWRPRALARSFLAPSGCWSVEDLAPGPVAVVVAAPGYSPSGELAVEVPEAGEGTADAALAREGRVAGVVVDATTRAPVPGARVALEGALPDAASVFPVLAETATDGRGRFELRGLPPRFTLSVAAAGHHLRLVSGLQVSPGEVTGPVEIELSPALPGEELQREFTGIGVAVAPRDDALVVTAVMAGGGAAAAGVARGDAIVGVDGVPVSALGFFGAIDAIRGAEGTAVVLRLRRDDATFELRVSRALVRG